MRDQEQPLDAEFLVLVAIELHPDRVERPLPHAAVIADLAHRQLGRRHGDNLVGASRAKIHAESPVDQQHVEAHEAEDRPSAGAQKIEPDGEAQGAEYQHEDQEALGTQRAVRRQHGRKDRGFRVAVVVGSHATQYRVADTLCGSVSWAQVRELGTPLTLKGDSTLFPHPFVDSGVAVKAACGSMSIGAAIVGLAVVMGVFLSHPIRAWASLLTHLLMPSGGVWECRSYCPARSTGREHQSCRASSWSRRRRCAWSV